MMYNMDGFTRLDHEGLIKDTLSLLNVDEGSVPRFYIYGQFKTIDLSDKFLLDANCEVEVACFIKVFDCETWVMESSPNGKLNAALVQKDFQTESQLHHFLTYPVVVQSEAEKQQA